MKNDEIKDKVEAWINQEGYPLEYKTYNALRRRISSAGLGMYVESREGPPREIDVFAQQSHPDLDNKRTFLVRLICECKYSKEAPWVLLYGDDPESKSFLVPFPRRLLNIW